MGLRSKYFRFSFPRYFRSGAEMLRMADVYYAESQHENAYVLYMKYLSLFIEKVSSNWLREFKLEVHVKMFMRVY